MSHEDNVEFLKLLVVTVVLATGIAANGWFQSETQSKAVEKAFAEQRAESANMLQHLNKRRDT